MKSCEFDGSNDYVNVTTGPNATIAAAAWSLSCWIKPTGGTSFRYILSNGYAVQITMYGATHRIATYLSSSQTSGVYYVSNLKNTTAYTLDAWEHFALVKTATTLTYYKGGAADGAHTGISGTTATATGGNFAAIGIAGSLNVYPFEGFIDEVAIFDVALSASQITNIYKGETNGGSGGTNGTPGDLETFSPFDYWRMGDGDTFPTLNDNGSGGNNGTMTNMLSGDIVEDVP